MRILYAGDSRVGGAANYLLGILKFIKADFLHLPPGEILKPRFLKKRYDAILLSDFSRKCVPPASEQAIVDQTGKDAGLLMIGGWGSFFGGAWRGSLIERTLPVSCLNRDDRVNFASGAWIVEKKRHAMFQGISFKNPPVICGLNRIRPRRSGLVVLGTRRVFKAREFPLLVVDRDPRKRIAALATDLAPHWSGGLVDWGSRRIRIRIKKGISIEVGDLYIRFVSSLLHWLTSDDLEPRYSHEELGRGA